MPHEDDPSVELAFDRAGVALSVTDTAGHLLHSNRAFGELFGWTEDDGVDISVISSIGANAVVDQFAAANAVRPWPAQTPV